MARTTAEKLAIKPGAAVHVAPAERLALLGPLPDGARQVDDLGAADTAVVFVDDAAAVRANMDANADAYRAIGSVWVVYPKGNRADINRDSLWPILSAYRFRPNTQIAIDDTWSALRFRPDREGEAPFTLGG
jgi:hypothetical protein